MMRVLVVEDETRLREQIRAKLTLEDYVVDAAEDGENGLFIAREFPLDAIILDLGLPELSGMEVIRRLRRDGCTTPILILTSRGRWQDKVEGLEAGADDYLTKPFQMEELLARIRALVRRAAGAAGQFLNLGPVSLDLTAQKVTLSGEPVDLTAFEYRLLEYLMKKRGKPVSKAELTDYLYPHDDDRDSNVLEVLVARLRKKLDPTGTLAPIETMRGRGYRFTLSENPAA